MDPYDYIRPFRGTINEYHECGVSVRQTFAWTSLHIAVDHGESLQSIQTLVYRGADERLRVVGNSEYSGLSATEMAKRKKGGKDAALVAVFLDRFSWRRRAVQEACVTSILSLRGALGRHVAANIAKLVQASLFDQTCVWDSAVDSFVKRAERREQQERAMREVYIESQRKAKEQERDRVRREKERVRLENACKVCAKPIYAMDATVTLPKGQGRAHRGCYGKK
jgi:hypothetical protein